MKTCQYCPSKEFRKRGSYKSKTGTVQRFQCKGCGKTQSKRTNSPNYRLRKQKLAKKIESMYCERMSLRGIARVLKVDRKTVTKYFLLGASRSRYENLKTLNNKGIVTTYVQFDALETFEHSKERPLGVYVSVRAKTGELISAKVHNTDIRALAISKNKIRDWNSKNNKEQALVDFLMETQKSFNRVHTTLGCDGYKAQINTAKEVCGDNVQVVRLGENKRIDLAIRKMRNWAKLFSYQRREG